MHRPRIHLVIDNCFASKRWTKPREWLSIARELSLNYGEGSADTECDPLYTDSVHLEEWIWEVLSAGQATGAPVVNLYSGRGTHTSLGLGSHDPRNQVLIRDQWLKVMGGKVLNAIATAYANRQDPGMLPRCEDIYLRLEILAARAALPADILHDLKESVSYWRKYVPSDGLDLGELLHQGEESGPPDL